MRSWLLLSLWFVACIMCAKNLKIKADTYQEFDPVTQHPMVFKYEKQHTTLLYIADQKLLRITMPKHIVTTEVKIDTIMYATTAMGEAITFYDSSKRRVLQLLEISIAQRYYTCELLFEKANAQWAQYNYWRCYPKDYDQFRSELIAATTPDRARDSSRVAAYPLMELLLH